MFSEEREYRDWLIHRFNIVEDYTYLLRELFNIEFYSLVAYDEDRGKDGLELRNEWADLVGYSGSLDFGAANVLEVIIGVAKRIEFHLFGTQYYDDWDEVRIFWELIDNLGLINMHGDLSRYSFDEIRDIVTLFLNRKYKRHKKCNIFDIEDDSKNLNKLNIWTQMGLYIRERWPI